MSVPNSYFGTKYQQVLTAAGVAEEKIFGRVTKVVDGNQQFEVKWDLDGETMTMSLNKVQYESVDTPLEIQSETSIITAEDLEGMVGDLEQGTASNAAKTHSLLVEEFDKDDADDNNTQSTTVYTLFVGDGATKKKCLEGIHIPREPGILVHNNEMKSMERKYLITLLLDMWDDFNSDKHSPESYVVWDKEHSKVKAEEDKENGKNKKKKKNTKRGKRKAAETFIKNIRKICEEKDDVEIAPDIEETEEEVNKKTRRGRKREDEESGEEIEEEKCEED